MEWQLKELRIDLQTWGEFAGKYVGKITFENGNKDAFTFTLSPTEMLDYLAIISKKVSGSAFELGGKITESMKQLGFDDKPNLQITAKTTEA